MNVEKGDRVSILAHSSRRHGRTGVVENVAPQCCCYPRPVVVRFPDGVARAFAAHELVRRSEA